MQYRRKDESSGRGGYNSRGRGNYNNWRPRGGGDQYRYKPKG